VQGEVGSPASNRHRHHPNDVKSRATQTSHRRTVARLSKIPSYIGEHGNGARKCHGETCFEILNLSQHKLCVREDHCDHQACKQGFAWQQQTGRRKQRGEKGTPALTKLEPP